MSTNRIAHLLEDELPKPGGPFSDADALMMLLAYRRNPAAVPCPSCGPDSIRVLAFIKPQLDADGFADETEPEGEYAAALYCRSCTRAIGILSGIAA